MRRMLLVGLLVALAILAPVRAQGTFTLYGQGTNSCGQWIEARKAGVTQDESWLSGFVSGVGYMSPSGAMKEVDVPALRSFVDQYCEGHRLDTIFVAAKALVAALGAKTP